MYKKSKKINKKVAKQVVPETTPQDGAYLRTLKQLLESRTD